MEEQWRPLIEQAENLSHQRREFARRVYRTRSLEIFQWYVRLILRLLAVPIRLRRDPAAKRVLRANIANALFRAKEPIPFRMNGQRSGCERDSPDSQRLDNASGEAGDKAKDLILWKNSRRVLTLYLGSVLGFMKPPITDASRMSGDSETISLFLMVCRIGNLNSQFGWLRGSLKRKYLLVAEA